MPEKSISMSLDVARTAYQQGIEYFNESDFVAAERSLRKASLLLREHLGEDVPETLQADLHIGHCIWQVGEIEDTEEWFGDLVPRFERGYGCLHDETLYVLELLAETSRLAEDYQIMEQAYDTILSRKAEIYGHDSEELLEAFHDLACNLSDSELDAPCAEAFIKAWKISALLKGTSDHFSISLLANAITYWVASGQFQAAVVWSRYAIEAINGDESTDSLSFQGHLGEALMGLGRYDEAEENLRDLVDLWTKRGGLVEPDAEFALEQLGKLCMQTGKYAEAEQHFRKLWEHRLNSWGVCPYATQSCLKLLLNSILAQGREEDARYLESIALVESENSLDPDSSAQLQLFSADLYTRMQDFESAAKDYQAAMPILEAELGIAHPKTLQAADEWADCLLAQDKITEASNLLERMLRIKREYWGENHYWTHETRNKLLSLQG